MSIDGLGVRAAFDVSLATLQHSADPIDQAAARAFGLLSVPDGPDLDVAAAARVLDHSQPTSQTLLERLVDAQLLETPRPGRYQFHDLARLQARQHATTAHSESERLDALTRLFGFYTATAWHTHRLLRPGDHRLTAADQRWTSHGVQFSDAAAGLDWLEAERPNLLAAISQTAAIAPAIPPRLATELTRALYRFFYTHSHWTDWMQANQTALELARRFGDRAGQAHTRDDLGVASMLLGCYSEALDHIQGALALFRELHDRHGQADSLANLGNVYELLERYPEAINHFQRAHTLFRELGDRRGQAGCLIDLGIIDQRLGRYSTALDYHQRALALRRELGDRRGQAASLASLGAVHERLGRFKEAISHQQQGLSIDRELSNRWGEAFSLAYLGIVYERLGRYAEALDHHQRALGVFRGAARTRQA